MKKALFVSFLSVMLIVTSGCGSQTAVISEPEVSSKQIELAAKEPITIKTEHGSYNLTINDVFKTESSSTDSSVILSFGIENIDFKNSEFKGVLLGYNAFSLYGANGEKLAEHSIIHDGFRSPNTVLPGSKDSFGIGYLMKSPSDKVDVIFSRGTGDTYKATVPVTEFKVSNTPVTLEESINSAIKTARAEKIKVSIYENAGTETADDMNVEIYLKGKDNVTTNLVRDGMILQANDILKVLQSRPDIAQVCLFWSMPLVESNGNKKDWNVMKLLIKKETLDNINFDNFDWTQLPNISDDYYLHSSLKK